MPASGVETTSFAGGQKVRYYFSLEDSYLLKKEWTEPVGNRGLAKKEVFYEKYTRFRFADDPKKWVRIPTTEKIFEDGELSLEKVYQEIKFNTKLDDKIFERPEGPDFERRKPAPGTGKGADSKPATKPATTSKPK